MVLNRRPEGRGIKCRLQQLHFYGGKMLEVRVLRFRGVLKALTDCLLNVNNQEVSNNMQFSVTQADKLNFQGYPPKRLPKQGR